MSTVSGHPDEMQGYVGDVEGPRDAAHRARERLLDAYDELVALLPAGFPAPGRPDVAGPLGRCRQVDELVGEVAERLRTAGAGRGDGTYELDAADLAISSTSPYGDRLRRRLARRAEQELARLRERMASGSYDETTVGELVAVLGWMRHEVDTAADPQAAAAALIDTMGPGDLQEIERMLVAAPDAAWDGDEAWVHRVVGDLAVVVSHGLEGAPRRAERWVAEIADDQDWYHHGPPPLLVALAVLGAPATVTLSRTVWRHVWEHTYSDEHGVALLSHKGPEGGELERLVGTRNAIEALADSAAERPALANAIVLDHVEEGLADFEHLFSAAHPPIGDESTYDALGRMLTASVDVSLPVEDRMEAASRTLTLYDQALAQGPVNYYDPEVRTGLATMTQPLLARLHPSLDEGIIHQPGLLIDDGRNPTDAVLERVVRDLAGHTETVAALGQALDGATSEILVSARVQAVDKDLAVPLDPHSLDRAGRVMDWMAATVTNERMQRLVDGIEGGGLSAGLQTALLDGIGATSYEPVSIVMRTVLDASGHEIIEPGDVLPGSAASRLTYQLVLLNIDADPALASPELLEGLRAAATQDRYGGLSGADGVAAFLESLESYDPRDYPGLQQLSDRVLEQRNQIDPINAELIAEVFDVG